MVATSSTSKLQTGLLGEPASELVLQVCGGEYDGRVVRLKSPKCTIGSAPNCTLRLHSSGVRPLHCLILRGRQGAVIRRWANGTQLNGSLFSDARLEQGDRIAVGHVELEVVELDGRPQEIRRADDAAAELSQLLDRIDELEAQVSAASMPQPSATIPFAELAESDDAVSASNSSAESAALRQRLEAAEADFERLREEAQAERQRIEAELSATRQQLETLETQQRQQTEASSALAAAEAESRRQLEEAQAALGRQHESASAERERLESDLSRAREQLTALQRELAGLAEIQSTQEQQDELRKTQVLALHDELESVRRSSHAAGDLKDKLHAAEGEAAKWRDQADWWRRRAEQLEIGTQQRQRADAEHAERLARERADYEQQRAAHEQQRAAHEQHRADAERERVRLASEIERLQGELADSQRQLQQAGEQLRGEVESSLAAERGELDELRRQFDEQRQQWAAERERFEAEWNSRNEQLQQEQNELTSLRESLRQQQAVESDAQLRLAQLEELLGKERTDWNERAAALEASVADKSSEIEQLRGRAAEHESALLAEQQVWGDQRSRLEAEVAARSSELDELRQRCVELERLQCERNELLAERESARSGRESVDHAGPPPDAALASPRDVPQRPPADSEPAAEALSPAPRSAPAGDVNVTNAWRRPEELIAEEEQQQVAFLPPQGGTPVSAQDVLARLGHGDMFWNDEQASGKAAPSAWRPPSDGAEESTPESPAGEKLSEPLLQQSSTLQSSAAQQSVAASAADSTLGEHQSNSEESIEDYMARLLKRVRGEDDPGAPRPQRTEAVYAPPPRASDAAAKPSPAQQAKQISINIVEPDSQPGEYLPRSQAPELTTNLKAMRELANESARTAIHTSVRKRGGASAMGRFFVAVAALIIGGMLIWLSPSFTSLTAYGAAASLVIGLLFAARGLADVRRYRSALRSRPSAQPRDAAVDPPAVEAPQDGTLSDDAPQVGD